jgi:predicted nucleotidyltransferase
MSTGTQLEGALVDLAAGLQESGIPFMVIGGIAILAHGVARVTNDVDATLLGEQVELEALFHLLGRHHIVPRIADALEFARRRQVLLLVHEPSGTPLEISLAWLPFEREALQLAVTASFGNVKIRVARPEDLVVYKAAAWRDRDRADIERLVRIHGSHMDLARVRALVVEIAQALEDESRIDAFDALIARALGQASEP